jgi:hypothetical protein
MGHLPSEALLAKLRHHPTTGPGGISADYIYYLEKTIRGLAGDQAVVVFLPGTAGDITRAYAPLFSGISGT